MKHKILWDSASIRLVVVELLVMMYWNENVAEQFVNVACKGMNMDMLVQTVVLMFNQYYNGMKHARIERVKAGKNANDSLIDLITDESRVLNIIG